MNSIPIFVVAGVVGSAIYFYPIIDSSRNHGGPHSLDPSSNRVLSTLNDQSTFQQVIDSDVPVVVDFYADWCEPCRKQSTILGRVAKSLSPRQARILKINVDRHHDLALRYGIESLPTLVVFKNGREVRRAIGMVTEQQFKSILIGQFLN